MSAGQVDGQVTGQVMCQMGQKTDESLLCARDASPPSRERPQTDFRDESRGSLPCRGGPGVSPALGLPRGGTRRGGIGACVVDAVPRSGAIP